MKGVTIAAKIPAKGDKPEKSAQITVQFPDYEADAAKALEEAKAAYGPAAILSNAFSNWRVTIQANMRTGLEKGETSEQLQARLGSAKMGVAATGAKIDPVQAFYAQYASATPAEQQKMLEELKQRAAKK